MIYTKIFFGMLLGAFSSSMWWLSYHPTALDGSPTVAVVPAVFSSIAILGFLIASLIELSDN